MKPINQMTQLELAVLVFCQNQIDLEEIERWSQAECPGTV